MSHVIRAALQSATVSSAARKAASRAVEDDRERFITRAMMRFKASDPTVEGRQTDAAPDALDVTRILICGAPRAGKSALCARLLHDANRSEPVVPVPGEHESPRINFRRGERAYAALEMPYRAFDAVRMASDDFDVALVVIDGCTAALTETRRQSYLAALAGIRQLVVAVTRLDVAGNVQDTFERIESAFRAYAARIELSGFPCIPLSAVAGDNVAERSTRWAWYRGPTLLEALEAVPRVRRAHERPLRLFIERVESMDAGGRRVLASMASGCIELNQRVRLHPSGGESRVLGIENGGRAVERAYPGQTISLTLADAIDIAPGDVAAATEAPAPVANQFEATVVWMGEQPLLRGRSYLMQCGSNTVRATVAPIKYKINVDTLERVAASELACDELGEVALELDRPIAFDPFSENPRTGRFALIDTVGSAHVGIGMLRFALRRADNVHWQAVEVDKRARQALGGHRSGVVWMTGLSGAGKSTLANMLEKRLHARGMRTYLLDGDNVRHGLNKDLGFTAADRVENIRRIAEVAKLMVDAGIIVITAFISPFRAERRMARELLQPGEFIEVFVDTPLAVAERRDPKGLYAKARRGELKNFTGIDSPYEAPEHPEVRVDTVTRSIERAVQDVYEALVRLGLIECE